MSDNLLSRSQQTMEIQRSDIPTIRVIIVFSLNYFLIDLFKTLPPLIEPNEIQCQWFGCDLLFSTPTQLTEVIP
jgi:hypothetical protein